MLQLLVLLDAFQLAVCYVTAKSHSQRPSYVMSDQPVWSEMANDVSMSSAHAQMHV